MFQTFWELTTSGELPRHMLTSLRRAMTGLAIGIVVGGALGTTAGLFRIGEKLVDPPMQMIRTIPMLAMVPLFIIWFGIHEQPKIVILALGTSFHIYINVYSGIRNVDARLVEAGRMLGLNHLQMIRHVILPGAAPQALVGLRLAIGTSWLLLVIAEQINAQRGLGQLLDIARQFLRADIIIVVLVIYALLALLADYIVRRLESRLLAWRRNFGGQ